MPSSYITKHGLHALDNYQYVSGGYSPLDNFVNPYWEFCVKLLPLWLAPNLVTAIGTIACVIHHAVVAWYSMSFDDPMPWWVHVSAGIAVFFYNTMDSIDGKQARRTKSSSPLGQLFDHGCDCFQTLIITLSLVCTLRLGATLTTVLFITSVQLPFFLAQWEEYHTHSIRTHVGFFGVTEGQYLTVLLFLGTPFLPVNFWNQEALMGFSYGQLLCGGFMLAPGYMSLSFLHNTISKAEHKLVAIEQLVAIVVNMGVFYTLFFLDGSEGFNSVISANPRLAFSAFMLLNVHVTTVVIVMNLAKQPVEWLPTVLFAPVLVLANAFYGFVPPTVALSFMVVLVAAVYLTFVVDVIETICLHRNIYCFKLGPRTPVDRHREYED